MACFITSTRTADVKPWLSKQAHANRTKWMLGRCTMLPVPRLIAANDLSDEALVIRFSPASAERLLAKAEQMYRYKGLYVVSVFSSDLQWPEMTDEEHHEALLLASELGGIDPEKNSKYWYCSQAGRIRESGFTFMKLDFDGEVAEHYSVKLGDAPGQSDAERFVAAFEPRKRG